MKMIFIVVNINENGKHYAFADTIKTGNNLLPMFRRYENADIVHLCETRKSADEIAAFWNECYKNNGTYYFSRTEKEA